MANDAERLIAQIEAERVNDRVHWYGLDPVNSELKSRLYRLVEQVEESTDREEAVRYSKALVRALTILIRLVEDTQRNERIVTVTLANCLDAETVVEK